MFRGILGAVLTCIIVISFGWIGLLISLPFLFAAPLLVHRAKEKWRRRGAFR